MTVRTRNGRTYICRSVRQGDRVVSRHVASGARAEAIARIEAQERALRRIDREEREALEATDRALAELCGRAEALSRAALEAAGYHQHKRQWRRRRMPPQAQPQQHVVEVPKGLWAIDRWAEDSLVARALAGSDEQTKGYFRREMIEFAAELAGQDPSPIEKALARTAALCWLAHRLAEASYANFMEAGGDLVSGEFRQRGIDRAHRRYLATLRSLALVRKLAQPAVRLVTVPAATPAPDAAPSPLPRSLYDRLAAAAPTNGHTNGHTNGTH